MDDQLRHILQHLYGEDPPVPVEDMLRDDDLRAEYEALRAVKEQLDERPPKRPPAEVVDRVVAAASTAAPQHRSRTDRPPKARSASRRRTAQTALAVTLVLLISVALLFTQLDGGWSTVGGEEVSFSTSSDQVLADRSPQSTAEEAAPPAAAPAPSSAPGARALASADSVAPDADGDEESPFKARVGLAASQEAPEAPAWDESDVVQRLHRRIELLEARSAETAWDDPAVMSLDVLPGTTAPSRLDRGLNTVRERRTPTGGQ
jgi:hypothetical protein